jgi:hypothetical protein
MPGSWPNAGRDPNSGSSGCPLDRAAQFADARKIQEQERPMQTRRFRPLLVVAAAALGTVGCIDMDMQASLEADGSGTMGMKIGFTDGFVEILQKMQEIDPEQDVLDSAKEVYFDEPSEETKAAMKAAGCEVLEFEGERNAKKIFSRFKVGFENVAALNQLDHIRPEDSKPGDGPGQGLTLTKNDDGTYTMAMSGSDDDESEDSGELTEEEIDELVEQGMEEGAAEVEEDPEEAMKKAAAAMELMGAMMAEMANLKIVVGMEVPGEIVSYSPTQLAKQDGQKVTWTIDMAAAMGGMGPGGMDDGFSVTFKMPEGQTIPESALTPAKKAADAAETGSDK